ncbi:MAG: NACHT and WD repeat domain-containing protein, partial [Chitinophagales bacterium]
MTLIRHKKDRFIPERPYHQTEQKAFFGRETETSELSDLVMYQKLVLVFGETGVGKSSLLRAGLMPKLSLSGFYPIYVTLQKEVEETPLSTVQKQVALHLPALPTSSIPPTGFLPETFEETTEVAKQTLSDSIINKLTDSNIGEIEQLPSLWNSLVLRDFYYNDEPATPVLILDQFEHFFNYTKSEQQQFITEIAKVAQSNVHLVFCLQSNYLSQLQQLSEAIPAIFHHRFLLKGMTQEMAKTVFKQTIHLDTDHFATQSFDIAPKTLHLITKHLIVGNGENVSLPALQIIGQYLEQQVLQNQESLPNQLITVDDNFFAKTQQIDQILGDYYTRGLPKNQKGSLWTRLLDATFSWRNILVFIALTVALLAWSYAYWQTDQSITKQKQALKAVASTLAAESRNALEQEVYPTALRLAEYAWETDSSNAQSYAALLNSYFNSRLYAETSGHRDEVLYADFAPNGQQFLTTSKDSLIRIWDLDGTLNQTLKGHKAYVFFAQFSNSGRYIVSTSRDNTARLWDRKGHLLHTLDHHQGFVNYATFSPNDSLIV